MSGKVTTYDRIPWIDAGVRAKGTDMGIKTGTLGRLSVKCLNKR